jgi:RecA-family ATPase
MTAVRITVHELQRALGGEISRGKNGPEVLCAGPGHSPQDRSLSVAPSNENDDGFVVTSFASDDWQTCKAYVRDRLRLPAFEPKANGSARLARREVKAYDYVSETGERLYQVVRFEPKGFSQRRPDGRGGWVWNLDGVERVLYRLPEVIEALATEKPVFVVEGEKDADALWRLGVPATCNAMGAGKGKWHDEYSAHFAGGRAFVIPDNDPEGMSHAVAVATSIRAAGGQAHIVTLPGLPPKGDASDWIRAGGSADELYRLAERSMTAPDPLPQEAGEAATKLEFIDPTIWAGQAVPPRRWLVPNRIPLGVPTMLSGDGAAGKTTIALQLVAATPCGADWLGSVIETPGPAIFVTAEEDADEVHRRLAAILEHQGRGFEDLRGVHLLCRPGDDSVLGAADRGGIIRATPLFESLLTRATEIRPSLIVIEASADVFAGNENDRGQVRQFVGLLRRLAMASGAAVLLIGHPSLTGMASGTGTSGSTAWNNSVRSRLYFASTKAKEGDEPDSDVRELRVMKSNYGPAGEVVRLRWQRGVFVPDGGPSTLERIATEAAIDDAFLHCLDVKSAQGIAVVPTPGRGYAPSVFEKMAEAKGFKSRAFALAMERLLSARRISVEMSGPPSKRRAAIVRNMIQ